MPRNGSANDNFERTFGSVVRCAPDAPAEPKKTVKTKTAVLQFPPPMSDD